MRKIAVLACLMLAVVFAVQQNSETHSFVAMEDSGTFTNLALEPPSSGTIVKDADLRGASEKALKLLQKSQAVWFQKENCGSCHHQLIPEIPIALARARNVSLDEKFAQSTSANTFAFLKDLDAIVQGYDYIDVLFDGWLLYTAEVAGIPPSLSTSASAQFIASRQQADGSWPTIDTRPPQSYGPFTTTAVCARAIKTYLPEQFAKERSVRLMRTRQWFLNAKPQNHEDRTYRLFGLKWTGADSGALRRAAQQLIASQNPDGGWSQLPGMKSDAYSTGEALAALRECVEISASDPGYQRGLRFLLSTQQADGSWHVSSRLHPPAPVSPPYFETGFPYKHDQFISAMGTSWAAAALMGALPSNTNGKASRSGADVAPGDQPYWVQVALSGTAQNLRQLLDSGMKVDERTAAGTTPLMFAARDLEKVKLLLERGADVNARASTGITALMVASRYGGNADVVRLLLKRGAKPNVESGVEVRNNASPLFFAVMAGDPEIVKLLIDSGAKINAQMTILGRFQESPLLYATFGSSPIVELLISRGADPNEVDTDKISLLSWASIANHESIVQLLLAKGANVNPVDRFGMTPLLYAASIDYGNTAIVERLIAAGADVNAKNPAGLTAADLAKNYGHQRMADLLIKKNPGLTGTR